MQDIDALVDDKIINHYTGTIVIYQPTDKPKENYGTKELNVGASTVHQKRLLEGYNYLRMHLYEQLNEFFC